MNNIPLKVRKECENDPKYKICAFVGQIINGKVHVCGGRVTWEHTLIYAGRQIQKKWSIIAICERAHGLIPSKTPEL